MHAALLLSLALASSPDLVAPTRHCRVDLDPLVSTRFGLDLIDDSTTSRVTSTGDVVISRGGAVTMMRTDTDDHGRPTRTLITGTLDAEQVHRLRNAVAHAIPEAPPEPCLIESFLDPGPGHSLYGNSSLVLYDGPSPRGRATELVVHHDDPSAGPTPGCPDAIKRLDKLLRRLQDDLRHGVTPLQCVPYR